ncbi:hypothetical protein GL279_13250 [Paracoccus limosus]|uniref:Uncharacterized protein n=1 Tax=Paracoccus limosus TaxID=913252 RepID=A0A844HAE0_9RHOB|nr:hypothetical protein [Paracoccus limosus]MTH35568.1 hypothetical protein [Paracoccus limosus]
MRPEPAGRIAPKPCPMLGAASIEVTPRTLARHEDARLQLPPGSEVFVANIEGTPFAEMLAAAARLRAMGLEPVPHMPARLIAGEAELADHLHVERLAIRTPLLG